MHARETRVETLSALETQPAVRTLPQGISRRKFNQALAEFALVVGDEWVFVSEEDVGLYRDAYSPARGEAGEIFAGAAVAPVTVEEVQAIARIANKHRIPLYPISTGRNLGYGGSAPVLPGSVVLDLKRMSRVLEVNEENAYALVEPGVSYFDLGRHIKEKGYRLWVASPTPGWGSVLGNALDRGTAGQLFEYNDHFGSHCGMEIVLADGELVRTGMGALPNAKSWQQYGYGIGPSVDGLFAQSNFGIVTKMGIHLMREPEALASGLLSAPRYSDIHAVIRLYNEWIAAGFLRSGTLLMTPLVLKTREENFAEEYPQFHRILTTGSGPTEAQWDEFGRSARLPGWWMTLNFFGPEEVVKAQWSYVTRRFSAIPGAEVAEPKIIKFPMTSEQELPQRGVRSIEPSLSGFTDGTRVEGFSTSGQGHVWFAPVIPLNGAEIVKAREVFTGIMNKWGFTPMNPDVPILNYRYCILIYGFRILDDAENNRRAREAFRELVKVGAEHGWGEYRTHTLFMDDVVGTFSFNQHALLKLHERLKDAIDPNGILSAGRYGIWPRHLRKRR